ncbi:hypothetical protein L1987_28278 [Smallanthus sonchifolius]|uniref:Uncharacterized protein n=1 Tax=Smallanthus sonchifolius TaxID=185202 RepID=A0ACB9IBR8_9ASTR|nr:hypothetical protein L1987_28278 [Smallanthus sonchifolius]
MNTMVIYDKVSGRSRGFGFVTMSSVEEVEEAVRKFNGRNRPLVGREKEAVVVVVGEVLTTRTGFMSVDNLALETLFREQENVLEAKVVYDMESGRPRGFVFVTYNYTDVVNGAIDYLNGVDLDGRNIRVSVAEAHKCISFKKLKEESDAYCEAVTTYIFYDHTDGGFMKDGFFASINVGIWWWWYTLLHRNKSKEQAYVSAWW